LVGQPVERRSHPAILLEAEGDHHPGGVSDETEMGLATRSAEGSVGPAVVLEHEIHRAADLRMADGEAEVGEGEQPPVRRDVLGPIQALPGLPEAARILFVEDLCSPSARWDLAARGAGLRRLRRSALDLYKIAVPRRRLCGVRKPSTPLATGHGKRHRFVPH